jgi:dihydroxyacid dehydratase/phosphogluconate dehydratase
VRHHDKLIHSVSTKWHYGGVAQTEWVVPMLRTYLPAIPANDKFNVVAEKSPNISIVSAYNEMLSAHQAYVNFPDVIRAEAHKYGATVQVAGGAPAMCDGIIQGEPGMELSLFSRDENCNEAGNCLIA